MLILTVVISASFAFCSLNSPETIGWSGPAGGTSVVSLTTTSMSLISAPESKKARKLASFQVALVAVDAVVAMESWFLCVCVSMSSSSGDGEEIGDDRSSWLDVSPSKAGGLLSGDTPAESAC